MEVMTWMWGVLAYPQTSTIILGAGVAVAVRSIHMNRLIAKRKETVQLLFNARNDDLLNHGLQVLERIHKDPNSNIRAYGIDRDKDDDAVAIRYVLNHWERIAIAIQNETYCEKIIKTASCSSFLSLHEQATPMILAIRQTTGKTTYFQEIDWLANRWIKAPLIAKKK